MSMAMQAIQDNAASYVQTSALDTQHESTKTTYPKYSLPKATREGRERVFLSKKQPQDLLGKESPGFRYTPSRQKELPKWGFGTAAARPPQTKPRYPETTNDLLHSSPDADDGKVKYFGASSMAQHKSCSAPDAKRVVIGNSSRNDKINAPDLCEFPLGGISPGPQRYRTQSCPPFRLAHAPKVDNYPPKYSMGLKTKILGTDLQTPPRVGPGIYPVAEACGDQAKSTTPSLPKWSMHKMDRFPPNKYRRDTGRLWDGEGNRKLQFNRQFGSSPSFGFGSSTRPAAQRIAPCYTSKDGGPAATMPKQRASHPELPPRNQKSASLDML